MSTVVSTFLKDRVSEKQLLTERVIEGALTVRTILNQIGASAVILSSFNVSTIADTGVGQTTVNFTAFLTQVPASHLGNANALLCASNNTQTYALVVNYNPATLAVADGYPSIGLSGKVA